MEKKFLIIWCMLYYMFLLKEITFAQNIKQNWEASHKENKIEIKIESKNTENLVQGIKFLRDRKYEEAARFFEKFLFSDMENLDELFGIGMASFGTFPYEIDKGIQYFRRKIDEKPTNYDLYHNAAILEIMGLVCDQKISMHLEKETKDNPKVHYILGLLYLLQSNNDLYKKECKILDEQNLILAQRLKSIYDKSKIFKQYLEERNKEK